MTQLINNSKLFKNKTYQYIVPSLNLYGRTFQRDLENLHIKSWCIGDMAYELENNVKVNALFCTCDNYMSTHDFIKKYHDTDTIIDYYNVSISKICIIINLPNSIKSNIIQLFRDGKYSELYDDQMIDELFPREFRDEDNIVVNEAYYIVKKHKLRKKKFEDILNRDFESAITIDEDDDRELDYKPDLKEEILNYSDDLIDYDLLKIKNEK